MTDWGEINRDAVSIAPTDVSRGKRLGFLEAYDASWHEQFLYASQFGAEYEYRNMEEENLQRIREATGQNNISSLSRTVDVPKSREDVARGVDPALGRGGQLGDWKPYSDLLEAFTNGGTVPPKYAEREKYLEALKKQFPDAGIATYSDMFGALRDKATKARMRASRDTSWLGTLGWFTGGVAANIDPRTNPINFLSLPIAGGESALARIGIQAVGQGAAETIGQFTGARENMRILGGNPTALDTALDIGGAAIGGAAIQGIGEAAGWLGRRWFRNTPNDPAPPIPEPAPEAPKAPVETPVKQEATLAKRMEPTLEGERAITRAVRESLGKGPSVERGARADFFHVRQQLESFAGPLPWEIAPPTSTRLPADVEGISAPRLEPKTPGETVDDIARRVDPETFRVYDNLQKRKQEARVLVEHERNLRDVGIAEQLKAQRDEVAKLEARLKDANKRQTKKITEKLGPLKSDLEQKEAALRSTDNNAMQIHRQSVMRLDEKMRDLAPAVSRAYERARGKWEVQQQTLKDVQKMMEDGKTQLEAQPSPVVDKAEAAMLSRPTVADSVPELRSAIAKPVEPGKDAVDEVQRVAQEMLKRTDEQLEKFRTDIKKLIGEKKKGAEGEDVIQLEGYSEPIKLDDKIMATLDDDTAQEMTVRELLERLDEDAEVLKAVSTCSVGVTSATA